MVQLLLKICLLSILHSEAFLSRINRGLFPKFPLRLNPDELSEAQLQEIYDLALGEEHSKELSKKVEASMQEDWDVREGVVGFRPKALPLKANIDLWSYNGKQDFLKGNFTSAEQWYQKCIDYNPVDGRGWLGLARILLKRGHMIPAEKTFKDGLYYNPQNPYLMQAYGVMLDKAGKTQQAVKILTSSAKSNPRHAASWVELGRINQKQGRVEEARFCYRSAVEGDPRSYVALQVWGVLEAEVGEVETARELFSRSFDLNSKSSYALQAWASMEKRLGNYSEAERLLKKAYKAWPDSTIVCQALAEVYEARGGLLEAREIFRRGERKAEAVGDAGFFQAWAMFELRQDEGGVQYHYGRSSDDAYNRDQSRLPVVENEVHRTTRQLFKRAVTVNKKHSASWVAWAKFEQRLGNRDVARRLLVTGISNFPTSRHIGWFHCALANLAKEDRDFDTARACYSRALDATASHKSLPVILEYAKMEGISGELSAARSLYDMGVSRFPADDRAWEQYLEFETRRAGGIRVEDLVSRRNQLKIKKNLGKEIPSHSDESSRVPSSDEDDTLW